MDLFINFLFGLTVVVIVGIFGSLRYKKERMNKLEKEVAELRLEVDKLNKQVFREN